MSSSGSAILDNLDTDELLKSIDYEELFEGTALEGTDLENGTLTEEIGRQLGEVVGRIIGEAIGGTLGAMLLPALTADSGNGDAEGESDSSDSEDAQSGSDDEDEGEDEGSDGSDESEESDESDQ